MSTVLLLGGTGAMGVYLRRELALLGYRVVVTSRRQRPDEAGTSFVVGNGKDDSFLKSVIESEAPDVIVDFMVYSTADFAARREILLSHVSQYIFLSSYRVFNEHNPLVEQSPRLLDSICDEEYLKTDEYGLSKARCENLLRESGRSNWTIVRPGITYSKERFQFGCLEADTVCYRAWNGLPVVMPKEVLEKRTTMTWGGDVAKMIARLVLNPEAYGEDFNVVTSENHTWTEIFNVYRDAIGLKLRIVSLADYLTICGKYQVCYDRMFDRVMDNTKILHITHLSQQDFRTLSEGLRFELEENKERLMAISPNVVQNAKMDKMCHLVHLPQGCVLMKVNYLIARFAVMDFVARVVRRMKRGCAR